MKKNPIEIYNNLSLLVKITHVSYPNYNKLGKKHQIDMWLETICAFKLDKTDYNKNSAVRFHFEDESTITINFN